MPNNHDQSTEEIHTLTVGRHNTGLWYVTGSMHRGLLVFGHTMSEALSRVEDVWADLRAVEDEDAREVQQQFHPATDAV